MKNLVLCTLLSYTTISFADNNRGGIDSDKIRAILIGNISKMQSCYQKELNKTGKTFDFSPKLNFTINKHGSVENSKVTSENNSKKEVRRTATCVSNVVKGITFPKPIGGGNVEVNQTFNFKLKTK